MRITIKSCKGYFSKSYCTGSRRITIKYCKGYYSKKYYTGSRRITLKVAVCKVVRRTELEADGP